VQQVQKPQITLAKLEHDEFFALIKAKKEEHVASLDIIDV
jgi:hypothetical protein